MIGIYCIENLHNNKCYIGQSRDTESRMVHHRRKLRAGTHHNQKLQYAWNKYGEDSFVFTHLESCQIGQLDELERFYINKRNSIISGYNLQEGGNKGKVLTAEHRQKISIANTGKTLSEEAKNKIREFMKLRPGVPMTEERKEWQRKFMLGKKMRLGKTGQKLSEDTRNKMSQSKIGNSNAKGSKRTEEEKQRLRELWTGTKRPFKGHTEQYYINHPDKVKP